MSCRYRFEDDGDVFLRAQHPGRQRLTELDRQRGAASAHDHADDPLRMRRHRKQGCRGAHVRAHDVRRRLAPPRQ